MKSYFLMLIRCFLFLLLFSLLLSEMGQSQEIKPIGTMIAKSTVISLADPESKEPREKAATYLPAGTRVKAYNITKRISGYDSRLILTESGLWGYVAEKYLFNPDEIKQNLDKSDIVIVQQNYPLKIEESTSDWKTINQTWLSKGEIHELINEDEPNTGIRIRLSKDKVKGTKWEKNPPEVVIPRSCVAILKRNEISLPDNLPYYAKNIIDGIFGIRKPCDSRVVWTLDTKGKTGAELDETLTKKLGGSDLEIKTIQDLGPDFNVNCYYYTKTIEGNRIYIVKKKINCKTNEVTYSYNNPRNNEYVFGRESVDKLPLNKIGQVCIYTYDDYFKIKEALGLHNFSEDEIDFIISQCVDCQIR